MDAPFIFDRYVTGRNFVGRKMDCNILSNLLTSGEHVVLYEPPKSGKMSVVQQTLFNMRMSGRNFIVGQTAIFNVRTIEDFLLRFGTAVMRSVYTTREEYAYIIEKYLDGTHFVFDPIRFSSHEEVVSLNWKPDENDMYRMLELPKMIAREKGVPCYVIVDDFQNLLMADGYDRLFRQFENVLRQKDDDGSPAASFIIAGSLVNAMKYIFEEQKYFYRLVEHLPLQPVDDRDIIEYVVKGFMLSGKVIERDLVLGACKLFRGNLWYLNHFTSICDSLSKGYINEGVLMEALKSMISIHEPKFRTMVNDLTDHQLSLMRAILDGVIRFSTSEVIEKYSLNSSANVRRVKDALKKKEIITFNEKDEPVILDPLFEYWIGKYYFGI